MIENFGDAIESAARSMYVSSLMTRLADHGVELKDTEEHYETVAGDHWDSGNADEADYADFRALAIKAVLASSFTPSAPSPRQSHATKAYNWHSDSIPAPRVSVYA